MATRRSDQFLRRTKMMSKKLDAFRQHFDPPPPVEMAQPEEAKPPSIGPVAKWFAGRFPKLPDEFGAAVLEEPDRHGKQIVCDISQPFLAATLGEHGTPKAPTIYLSAENRFYTYSPE